MALPKIDVPTYDIELPVSKKTIKYRPFLVKEQRNLLMAMESDDALTINKSVKDIRYNCTLTEDVDIDKLPIIDVEYYFINLRAKSVGETVESKYRCNNEVNGEQCGNLMETETNLADIKVDMSDSINPEIQLTENVFIKMKYPEFNSVEKSLQYSNLNEITFNMIADSIEYVYDGEQFYYASDAQPGEFLELVENLNNEQFKKIENFISNLPTLKHTMNITCSKCGYQHKIQVEGLENFFA